MDGFEDLIREQANRPPPRLAEGRAAHVLVSKLHDHTRTVSLTDIAQAFLETNAQTMWGARSIEAVLDAPLSERCIMVARIDMETFLEVSRTTVAELLPWALDDCHDMIMNFDRRQLETMEPSEPLACLDESATFLPYGENWKTWYYWHVRTGEFLGSGTFDDISNISPEVDRAFDKEAQQVAEEKEDEFDQGAPLPRRRKR